MSQLPYTMFHEVLFPQSHAESANASDAQLNLRVLRRFRLDHLQDIRKIPITVFDFETTGLSAESDRIIEIGALRMEGMKIVDQFSALIDPGMRVSDEITRITGITPEMLVGQAKIADALPDFLEFIKGSLLLAHNAEFDLAFLRKNCQELGYELDWDCFCSLKVARAVLPQLESRNLDTLAKHYGLSFEARHRSIGDCKVTAGVLNAMLEAESPRLYRWQNLEPFQVV